MTKLAIRDLFPTTQEIHFHAAERANRNMNKHCRSQWNDEDEDIYFATYYHVFEQVAGPDHSAVIQYKRDLAA